MIDFISRSFAFIFNMFRKLVNFLKLDILLAKFFALPNKYKAIMIGILCILIILYKFFSPSSFRPDIKVVEAHIVKKESMKVTTKLLGSIQAKRFFTIEAINPGIIEFVANPGSKIKKGQKIVELDAPEIESAYTTAVKAAEIAQLQYQREEKLVKSGNSSQSNLEKKYIALANAKNMLANAKTNLDKVLFTAPFDGTIGSSLFYEGSKVNPGDKVVTFYDDSDLVVKFDIPSEIAAKLGTKSKAKIDDKEYDVYIQKALSKHSYSVPSFINYKCDNCIIGEVTDVELYIIDKKDIFTLPTNCVFIHNGKQTLYKVKGNKAMIGGVKIGSSQKGLLEILEGVEEGDVIVKGGQARLYPYIDVKIHNG